MPDRSLFGQREDSHRLRRRGVGQCAAFDCGTFVGSRIVQRDVHSKAAKSISGLGSNATTRDPFAPKPWPGGIEYGTAVRDRYSKKSVHVAIFRPSSTKATAIDLWRGISVPARLAGFSLYVARVSHHHPDVGKHQPLGAKLRLDFTGAPMGIGPSREICARKIGPLWPASTERSGI